MNSTARPFPHLARPASQGALPSRGAISKRSGEAPISEELRAEICSGRARPERKLAICSGGVSLPPEERVELLTVLAVDTDSPIAERAQGVLLTQPVEVFLAALGRVDADPRLFIYCAQNLADKPGVADALASNPACPADALTRIAAKLTSSGIQALLDDLIRLTASPACVRALAQSTGATLEQRELLQEMQKGAPFPQDLDASLADAEPDAGRRMTLLQRLSGMSVVERIQLALRGNREERMSLIRDPNKIVQRSVLESPRITDSDIESFSSMTTVSSDTLRNISINRHFMKNYTVIRNLTSNPKTPLDVSLHLLPLLNPSDLKILAANRNVPETLRNAAIKLQRQRTISRHHT